MFSVCFSRSAKSITQAISLALHSISLLICKNCSFTFPSRSIIQLFSDRVRVAMELYKDDPKCIGLADAATTIAFIRKVDDVIKAMMSRIPGQALRPHETCPHKKVCIQHYNPRDINLVRRLFCELCNIMKIERL